MNTFTLLKGYSILWRVVGVGRGEAEGYMFAYYQTKIENVILKYINPYFGITFSLSPSPFIHTDTCISVRIRLSKNELCFSLLPCYVSIAIQCKGRGIQKSHCV